MSLTELKTDIDDDHKLHLPDVKLDHEDSMQSLRFEEVALSTLIPGDADTLGVRLTLNTVGSDTPDDAQYIFSEWSRQQLLSLFGVRERWFTYVELPQQVAEFNIRKHGLTGYSIRTSLAVDNDFPVRFVRGIVSDAYADIPNSDIMSAVVEKMPANAMALRYHSGLTDRAFYAYVVSPTPLTIPGTTFFAYPGALVKNSDVGFTSLYVIPTVVPATTCAPIVIEGATILKRIHRGHVNLLEKFGEAFDQCAILWGDYATKILHLATKQYSSTDNAVEMMTRLLANCLASKDFIRRCQHHYRSATRKNTALDIFDTVSEVCATYHGREEHYTVGAIAGAVLFRLMF